MGEVLANSLAVVAMAGTAAMALRLVGIWERMVSFEPHRVPAARALLALSYRLGRPLGALSTHGSRRGAAQR